jgi:hypothetical protein
VNRIARLQDILAQAVAKAGKTSDWALDLEHGYEGHQGDASERDRQPRRATAEQILGERPQADRERGREPSGLDGGRSDRGADGSGWTLTLLRAFDEGQHPRDDHGRWTDSGAGGGGDGDTGGEREPSAAERADHVDAVFRVQGATGRSPLTFHNLTADGSTRFHGAIERAKTADKFGACVHAYPAHDYRDMNIFVTPDNTVGFAIKTDGDIVSAFKHPNSDAKKAAKTMLMLATNRGGRKLDAFDTILPDLYSEANFRAVARLAWNDEHAPAGWSKDTYAKYNKGEPDVVFMVHDPASTRLYKAGDGKRVTTYEDGVAEQARALAEIDARHKDFDESQHPRDEQGRWTDAGGGGGGGVQEEAAPAAPAAPKLNPEVVNVGGDEWNRASAVRLETEYQNVKDKLEEIEGNAKGKPVTAPEVESDDEPGGEPPFVPEEWDMLSGSGQSQAEEEYKSKNLDSYIENETTYWYESGGAADEAGDKVAYEFNKGNNQWAMDALNDNFEEKDFPYTTSQILDAIELKWNTGYEGDLDKSLEIEFDDDKLQEPTDKPQPTDPAQLELPGTPPPEEVDWSKHLTPEMRDNIIAQLKKSIEKEIEDVSGKLDPPEYLSENADEYLGESWDQMSDKDKFEWVKSNTNIVEDESTEGTGDFANEKPAPETEYVDKLPETYDPLNETSGNDYKRTQKIARFMSVERAVQVMVERKVGPEIPGGPKFEANWQNMMANNIKRVDSRIWNMWKSSSTSNEGMLLQLAAAEELGGRLNVKTGSTTGSVSIFPDALKSFANGRFEEIGGYEGVKAYLRAKWETTQYLLDAAGQDTLVLYRGIRFDREKFDQLKKDRVVVQGENGLEFSKLPQLHIDRNGAASTSFNPAIANGWDGDTAVVLRAEVPRTAVLSVPAYGVNIQSEQEVVIAGTSWKAWDAWAGRAPNPEIVPMAPKGSGIGNDAPLLKAA